MKWKVKKKSENETKNLKVQKLEEEVPQNKKGLQESCYSKNFKLKKLKKK